jgi:transcriptional regulator with GAF, ATPase, and Fis domain
MLPRAPGVRPVPICRVVTCWAVCRRETWLTSSPPPPGTSGRRTVEHTLEKSVQLAVELISGADACGVTLVQRGHGLKTPVSTGDMVVRGDALQYGLGEGPCMDAVWEHEVVISHDLAEERRWPSWAPRVVEELGARSMMCIQLFTDTHTLGAMNMYSKKPHVFNEVDDAPEAQALSAHIAVALAAAQEIEHLHTALTRRTEIGQAEGILMERFGITGARAFEVLRRVSSHSNRKLQVVALELVETRRLPTP